MNFESIKSSFLTHLVKEGKIDRDKMYLQNEDVSIFMFANEFKSFLQSEGIAEYNNLISKSVNEILEMDFDEDGKLVDPEEIEAYEESLEELTSEKGNSDLLTEENADADSEKVNDYVTKGEECEKAPQEEIVNEVRADITAEVGDDITDEFNNKIDDEIYDEILKGEVESSDIFKDVFNDLLNDDRFKNAIDADKTGDISKEEFTGFIDSIKDYDNNKEDVSVDDLLTAAAKIGDNTFEFISVNKSDVNTKPVETIPTTTDLNDTVPTDNLSTETINNDTTSTEPELPSLTTEGINPVSTGTSCGNENLDNLNNEMQTLTEQKATAEDNLNTQTEKYNTTQAEKEDTIGAMNCDIQTGQCNLSDANEKVCTTNETFQAAQCELETAVENTAAGKQTLEQSDCELQDRVSDVCDAQETTGCAQVRNQEAIEAETGAQEDTNAANEDLTTAIGNTGEAQGVADQTGAELAEANVSAAEAFSVVNLKNQEVAQAQSEYNNAQASAGKDQSLWDKFKSWVSSAFNRLQDAIAGRDHAQAEAEREAKRQKEAQIASDEALSELEERKEEQDEAQAVFDAAGVVLDRATQEREVTDQEYAESLVFLTDAMESQEDAEAVYNTAFDNYMQLNDYQVDAEGKLQDAEGNYISATQVAQEFETYLNGMIEQRDTKETSYDNVLMTTAGVINQEEGAIAQLETQISELEVKIEQEERNIALQEQMITKVANEQSELNAAESSAGIIDDIVSFFGGGNAAEQKEINTKQEALEKALLSGDTEAIKEAYKAIYGDEKVYLDEEGNVIHSSQIEEGTQNYTTKNLKDLSDELLSEYINQDADATINAAETVNLIDDGTYTYNNQPITREELNAILLEQVAQTQTGTENAIEQQGILSRALSSANNLLGIGTSEAEMRAQASAYSELASNLNNCTDPVEYAALFEEITGTEFNREAVVELLAYSQLQSNQDNTTGVNDASVTTGTETNGSTTAADNNDLTGDVNTTANNNGSTSNKLLFTQGSRAQEAIQDYKETQTAIKDGVVGTISGVAAVAAVAAAPLTGGASLLLAAGVGAASSTVINAADSVYDADGDGNIDFNYTAEELFKDAAMGALNGTIGKIAHGAGSFVSSKLSGSAGSALATTTQSFTQNAATSTLSNTGRQVFAKYAGIAVEGYIDGAVSSGGQYAINAAFDSNIDFSFEQMIEISNQGGTAGMLFDVGLNAAGDITHGLLYGNQGGIDTTVQPDNQMRYEALEDGSQDQILMLGDGSLPGGESNPFDGNPTAGSGAAQGASSSAGAATGASSNAAHNIDYSNLQTEILRGNRSASDVLDEVIIIETNQKILTAYENYLNNPGKNTLSKLRQAFQSQYHPDTHNAYSSTEAAAFYNLLIDNLIKTV